MIVQHHPLGFAGQLDLAGATAGLHLLHGTGRGLQAQLPAGWISVWMPLSGALALDSQDTAWSLPCRRLQIWRDSALRVSARGPGWWIALCGPADRWAPHLPAARQDLFPELFPGESHCPNELRRLLVRLAQIARVRRDEDAGPVLAALCHALVDSQRDLQRRLQRCSGRTQRRRQQTLLRLLRVRQQIERHDDGRLDLTRLARIANYSPCHLIRMHREVFDETPCEYAARLRFDRAWRLVRETRMPVCEITEALGFESQSAFCRAFKHAYGVTTTQARERLATSMSQIATPDYRPASRAA